MKPKMAHGLSSNHLFYVFDTMCKRVKDWRQFAKVLGLSYLIRDLEEDERYHEVHEKINKCIEEARQTAVKADPDWYFWRTKLLQICEGDLVEDIEDTFRYLLQDSRIDLTSAVHSVFDGFAIFAHHADRPENFDCISVKVNKRIKICVSSCTMKIYSLKMMEELTSLYDEYFHKYNILHRIKMYDFSNINKKEECQILKTQHTWLQKNKDPGFTVKGYDANEHLQSFSDYINYYPQKDSILTYSEKHNIIFNIIKVTKDMMKSMRINCSNIRPLRTINKCLHDQPFIYLPIMLYDKSQSEAVANIKCDTCNNLELIVASEKFKNLNSFEEWLENILPSVKLIKKKQIHKTDRSDISVDFLKSIIGFIALDNSILPNFDNAPENEIKELEKLIMFSPEQLAVIYADKKRKLIKGSFGTGKTIVAQQLVKLVQKDISDLDFVYYIIHDSKSAYIQEMKKFINSFKKDNMRACTISAISGENKSISSLLQHISDIHSGGVVHVFMEEFDGEVLDKQEVENIVYMLEKDIFKNSHLVVVCQSMECDRSQIINKDPMLYNRYMYQELLDQANFNSFDLSYLLRSSKQINDMVEVAIPILEKVSTQSFVPSKTNLLLLKSDNFPATSIAVSAQNTETSNFADEIPESYGDIPEFDEESNAKSSEHQDMAYGFKKLNIIDTDKLLKQFTVNSHQYESKTELKNSFNFYGLRKQAHSVKGKKPVIYYPFKISQNYSQQIFSLSNVFKKLELNKNNDKQVIITMNDDSMDIIMEALELNKIKWTDDPQLLSTDEFHVLLTDYTNVRGCEFLNVILIIPTDEQYLKHYLVGGLCRCVLNLKVVAFNREVPDNTLLQILYQWENKNLVEVDKENYIENITKEELKELNEISKHQLIKDNTKQIVDISRAEDIHNLFNTVAVITSIPRHSYQSKTVFREMTLGTYVAQLLFEHEQVCERSIHFGCNAGMTIAQVLHYFEQILNSLCYLHKQGLLHGDVKSHNVVFLENGVLQLIGLESTQSESLSSIRGTRGYAGAEVYRGKQEQKSDVHSASSILPEILGLFMMHLLRDDNNPNTIQRTIDRNVLVFRLMMQFEHLKPFAALFKWGTTAKVSERPTIFEITEMFKTHETFNQLRQQVQGFPVFLL